MIMLHVYTSFRPDTQIGTLAFVAEAKREIPIMSRKCDGETDFPDFVREFWGREDMIILEQDKEPTIPDLLDLMSCPKPACCYPYPVSFWRDGRTPMSLWTDHFPYGTGFVKFSKEVQRAVPWQDWYADGSRWYFDGRLEDSVMAKSGPMHIHDHMIKHNHHPTKLQWVLALLRGH